MKTLYLCLVILVVLGGCGYNEKEEIPKNSEKNEKVDNGVVIGILGLRIGETVDINDPKFKEKYKISLGERKNGYVICDFIGTKKFRNFSKGQMYVNEKGRIIKLVTKVSAIPPEQAAQKLKKLTDPADRHLATEALADRIWMNVLLGEYDKCLSILKRKYGGLWKNDSTDSDLMVESSCRLAGGYSIRICGIKCGGDADVGGLSIVMADEDGIRNGRVSQKDLNSLE